MLFFQPHGKPVSHQMSTCEKLAGKICSSVELESASEATLFADRTSRTDGPPESQSNIHLHRNWCFDLLLQTKRLRSKNKRKFRTNTDTIKHTLARNTASSNSVVLREPIFVHYFHGPWDRGLDCGTYGSSKSVFLLVNCVSHGCNLHTQSFHHIPVLLTWLQEFA